MPKILMTLSLVFLIFSASIALTDMSTSDPPTSSLTLTSSADGKAADSHKKATKVVQLAPKSILKRVDRDKQHWREDPERLHRHIALSMSAAEYLQALQKTGMKRVLTSSNTPSARPAGGAAGHWQELGPYGGYGGRLTYNGRVAGIRVIDSGNGSYYVFIGGSGGGIWWCHSSSLGTWNPIAQNLPNPSIRAFAINPNNYSHIVVCTGDPGRYKGAGIYVTRDFGATWHQATLPNIPDYFYRVEFRLNYSTSLVAASELGIMLSEDGGDTWTFRWQGTEAEAPTDLRLHPTNDQLIYAVAKGVGFLRSTDGGYTWGPIPGSSGLPSASSWGRASLAISPDSPETMAVIIGTPVHNNLLGIWRTVDAGMTWTDIKGDLPDIGNTQMFHAQAITFEPGSTDTIWAASINLARTKDGGNTWVLEDKTDEFDVGHADVTQLLFSEFSGNDILWICNDGGIYVHTISAKNTIGLNGVGPTGLRLSQIDHVESRRTLNVIGLIDNGELRQDFSADWHPITDVGDGGRIAIMDAEAYDFWYWIGVPWSIYRVLNAGSPVSVPIEATASLHYDPFEKKMYVPAGGKIYVTGAYDADPQWSQAPIALHTNPDANIWGIFGSKADGKTIYAMFRDNFKRDLGVAPWTGSAWTVNTSTDLAPSGGRIMTIAPSSEWPGEAWVGFFAAEGLPKVAHTTDYGQTWEDVSGELTSCKTIYALAPKPFDPRVVYAATGIGVFRTIDGGRSWQPFQEGLPIVMCKDIKFVVDESAAGNHRLIVATYGRGLWWRSVPSRPIIYVDKTNSSPEDGSIEHPYRMVAQAVSAAPEGATVAVHANTYVEPQTIDKNDLIVVTWGGKTTIK